jgi:hypothetical protein
MQTVFYDDNSTDLEGVESRFVELLQEIHLLRRGDVVEDAVDRFL